LKNRNEEIVLCDTLRTPFCHGSRLKNTGPEELLARVIGELIERNKLDGSLVSAVTAGTVLQDSRTPNIARMAAGLAGLPVTTADYTVQNNCNSAFVGMLSALGAISCGLGELYITTGVESMSRYSFRLDDPEGVCGSAGELEELLKNDPESFRKSIKIIDKLEECLTDRCNNVSMIEVGEIMANLYGISREEQDSYTLENLKKAVRAVEERKMAPYIVEIDGISEDTYPLNRKKMINKPQLFSRTTEVFSENNPLLDRHKFYEKHKKHLKALGIDEIKPTVTMYNSSIPGDGAGGCIITTESYAREAGLTPRFRIINWAVTGVDPVIMGIGPNEAVEKLFSHPRTSHAENLSMEQMDQIEIHEAFAAQVLSVFKESENKYGRRWNREKINPYGGSLAYTHPLGATNFRMLSNVFARFDEDPTATYALMCGCAGGGQGTAVLLQRY